VSLKQCIKKLLRIIAGEKAVTVLLFGEMGAGKTTLVSAVVNKLVGGAHPSSPSFNIVNRYSDNLFHADLYRIKHEEELVNIGFREIIDGDNIVFIEWPQNAPKMLGGPENKAIRVYIEVKNDGRRNYIID
jgi:tRNA threonylcarbamoyladenosine biosynthesis protein TsaE